MASRTTIIESNRQIAYNSAKQSTLTNNAITDQTGVNYSNSRWQTFVPDGIQIKAGDELQLEAAMINSVGAGDEVLEFGGSTNLKYNGEELRDNVAQMEVEFYMNNLYQFNFNLPKSRHSVNYNLADNSYGGPAFETLKLGRTSVDNFNVFEGNYPYQATEGQSVDVTATPRVYTDIPASFLPSIMKPPPRLRFPNATRIFLGKSDYIGPYYEPTLAEQTTAFEWETYKQSILFNLPEGFSTPAAVAERMTAQMHSRTGSADQWTTTTEIPPYYFIDDNGVIINNTTAGVTDATYINIPTSQGYLFQLRKGNKWSAAFEGEKSGGTLVPRGTNYQKNQGLFAFYAFMMSALPGYMKLVNINPQIQVKPCDDLSSHDMANNTAAERNKFSVFTGPRSEGGYTQTVGSNVYYIGAINAMRLMNTLNLVKAPLNYYSLQTPMPAVQQTHNGAYNASRVDDLICTNLIFNDDNLKILATAFEAYGEYVDKQTQSTDITDEEFRSANSIPFNFTRMDDQEAIIPQQRDFKLPPKLFAGEQQKYDIGSATVAGSYLLQDVKQVGVSAVQGLRQVAGADYEAEFSKPEREYRVSTYLPKDYTAEKIFNNTTILRGINGDPTYNNGTTTNQSEFEPTPNFNGLNYLKELYDSIPTSSLGPKFCFIPVFVSQFAPDGDGTDNIYNRDIPFIAFKINKIPDQRGVFPARGEFCGFDPTLLRCEMAKASTTQKYQTNADGYRQPTTASQARIDQYVGSCFIGASDAAVNFDGNYSRMTLSDFHTPIKNGNGQFQNPKIPPATDPLQDIMSMYYNQSHMVQVQQDGVTPFKYNQNPVLPPYTEGPARLAGTVNMVVSAQAGIAISDIKIPFITNSPAYSPSKLLSVNYVNSQYYKDTLFDKLGFSLEQLKPRFGLTQSEFNRGNYNKYLGYGEETNAQLVQNNMVKPFTTNAYISASEQISFAQMVAAIKSGTNTTYEIVPSANLGQMASIQGETNAVSDILIAANLPRKLDFPYLVVYSDIVRNPSYLGGPTGHEKLSAIAYITRNYTEGDYFFSFATNWSYTADSDYVITSILTDIRLPDGRPAPIDDNSSCIYKITTPQLMPVAPQMPTQKKKSTDDKPEARSQSNKRKENAPSSRQRSKSTSASSSSSSGY